MAWRLNKAAEDLDMKQVDVADALNERPATVGNWFQGLNYPRRRQRTEIAQLLKVAEEWLFEGGEYKTTATVHEEQPVGASYTAVREVPVISWTHAGVAASYEEMPRHFQGTVATTSRVKKAFGLTVEGDSMLPKYMPGDIVVLEPGEEPRNGKAVVVKFADDAIQLRIYQKLSARKIRLTPYNPAYSAAEHHLAEFNWIYPVKQTVRNE